MSSHDSSGLSTIVLCCAISGVGVALVTGTLSYLILLALAIIVGQVAVKVIQER